jgi:hypothetical protein
MDNFQVDITSGGAEDLKRAMGFFSLLHKVTGYRDEGRRFVLYRADSPSATKLPFPLTREQAADLIIGWLEQADYGPQPDHDGHNGKGWRLHNGAGGHIGGEWQALLAVEPVWAEYGV